MAALSDCLYESARPVHLAFCVEQCLLFLAVHALLVVAVGVHHIGERARHEQFRYVSLIQGERYGAVVGRVNDEVGRNLLRVSSQCLTHRGPRLRVQLADFRLQRFRLDVA